MKTVDGLFIGSTAEFAKRGREIYRQVNQELEKEHKGKVLLIEVESEDYFVDEKPHEAMSKAKAKYPDKIFYCSRVGFGPYRRYRGGQYNSSKLF
jgi:hypothetical protein